jgi:hypothetical protein
MIGGQWDISWHRSIGRDTFWTPAHMAIYLCGVLAGLSCGYLILATTFGNFSQLRSTSVKMWGFEGPLGAFIAAWGGVAMLTSAPFDNWWHSAYGLDVKILSPPHVLLILGNLAVNTGTLILILGMMNRARAEFRDKLNWLFLYIGGVVLIGLMLMIMEFSWHALMHNGVYYRVVCMVVPLVLAGVARASEKRWAATTVAAVYWLFWAGMGWILPLFPAEPKLGPVYHQVTQFVPPEFPMLLFIPALALDILWSRTRDWNLWKKAAVSGLLFLGVLIAVQWPFASFLQLPAARNWFFHTNIFDYNARPHLDAPCVHRAGCAPSSGGDVSGRRGRHCDHHGWDSPGAIGCGGCAGNPMRRSLLQCSSCWPPPAPSRTWAARMFSTMARPALTGCW